MTTRLAPPAKAPAASLAGCSDCGIVYEGRCLSASLHELAYGRRFLAIVEGEALCHRCWNARGRPFPRYGAAIRRDA